MTRVLVMDDEDGIRSMIRSILEGAGFTVATAEGSHEGLRLLGAEPFDLIITDIFMPEGDGLEALIALQPMEDAPPVIAISGGSQRLGLDSLAMATTLGAASTLRKPFRPAELLSEVRTVLGGTP